MTNKEIMSAIDNIEGILTVRDRTWLKTAKEAIEKQLPKKPIKYAKEVVCPTCITPVGRSPYCDSCGQSLDWHAYEDEEGRL